MKYGLIGKTLKHSFSKSVHSYLDSKDYELVSLNEDELDSFLKRRDFLGINVTIPYKEKVIPYLDYVSPEVKEIGACNTIVNKNGKLYGYNTDYYGLESLINHYHYEIENKVIAILGTGGTKNTTYYLLKKLKAKKIYVVSRNPHENEISYSQLDGIKNEIEIIINTTPVGMYPNNDKQIISLKGYNHLKGLIDVIYNPLNTCLVLEGKKNHINSHGGLYMLIGQAIRASELFLDKEYDKRMLDRIYFDILKKKENIVLIGMPMSGKTRTGKILSSYIKKEYIDMDKQIESDENRTINEIFSSDGETYFRNAESLLAKNLGINQGKVISTGGGIILNPSNMMYLKQNGIVIYLTRDFDKLIYSSSRPLTKSKEEYLNLEKKRKHLYLKYKDIHIDNSTDDVDELMNLIKRKLYEKNSHY
jgi:shikimate dehydrogenase